MKSILIIITYFISLLCVNAQNKITISGYVSDSQSMERLIAASVLLNGTNKGTVSNKYGFYSLTIPSGNTNIQFSYVGCQPQTLTINLHSDTTIDISLNPNLLIGEVVVKASNKNKESFEATEPGVNVVLIDRIKKMPVIGGESDVFKTLQLLPGVKQSQEGTAGINVRGGSPDQNLILLDGVPVYNATHLFGFLSVFNSDALNHVKIYKGGIPARYGGRISSVVDITMKEGNLKVPRGVFSVSPLAGKLTIEGPIKPDTSSFIISGRRSFLDLPVRLGLFLTQQPIQAGYYFYDLTGKANWIINRKNRVYFSSYFGKDKYFIDNREDGIKSDYSYRWGNYTSVFRWNRQASPKLFINYIAYFSHFNNKQKIIQKTGNNLSYQLETELNDFSLAVDFDYIPVLNHYFKFGIKSSLKSFSPLLYSKSESKNEFLSKFEDRYRAVVNSAYIEDNFYLISDIKMNMGVRVVWYKTGSKMYSNIEPRLSVNYSVSPKLAIKASYTKMSQYIHMLSNTSIGLPTELWVAATEQVKPQTSWQMSMGLYSKPLMGITASVNGYYKKMNDVIRLKEGSSTISSRQESWEDKVITGLGESYGTELLLKKENGKFTGWVGYTLSWSNRTYKELNNGKPFPYRYDKRHDISLLGEYEFYNDGIDKKSFSLVFTFNTGNAVSIPDIKHKGKLVLADSGEDSWLGLTSFLQTSNTFSIPNDYRMPAFHHLDIGYHLTRKLSEYKSRTWSFSVYNVYNRLNPWYFYKKGNKLRQVSMFPIIPSVSFTYKW